MFGVSPLKYGFGRFWTRGLSTAAERGFADGLKGEELLNAVLGLSHKHRAEHFDTVVVGFTDIYGRLLGKRYDIDYFLNGVTAAEDIKTSKACNYTMAIDLPMNPLEGFEYCNWEKGFGDFVLKPDVETFRVAAWLNRTLIILCDVIDPNTGEMLPIAPRSVLKNAISKLDSVVKEKGIAKKGVIVNAATELEFYLYDNSYDECAQLDYRINPSSSFNAGSYFGQSSSTGLVSPAGRYMEDYHVLQGTRNEDFYQKFRGAL